MEMGRGGRVRMVVGLTTKTPKTNKNTASKMTTVAFHVQGLGL
jgi:hypothetical protein